MHKIDVLKKFSFFSGFEEKELEMILAISIEHNYKKNMILFMEGDPGEAFYYICSGKVKVFRTYEDGREHIIHILGPGDVFGEATLFSCVPYPASAQIYEDAVIGSVKNTSLENLVEQNPELALKLLKVFAKKLVFSQQKIKELTFSDVFSRTSSQLVALASDHGSITGRGIQINLQLTRQELAEMVGTTRETVSRVLSRFRKEKSIVEENDHIVIINEKKLRQWI